MENRANREVNPNIETAIEAMEEFREIGDVECSLRSLWKPLED
jgi:hypothetical protein